VADAIEGLCGANVRSHASAIAHHLYQAGAAADLDKTVAYLLMAAREACAGAAHEEALANVDTALSLVEAERHPLTAELHGARAVALRSLSRFAEAVESYERAIASFVEAGHIAGATEASFHLAYLHLWSADHASALTVVDRAFRIAGTESWPWRRRLLFLRALSFGIKGDMEASLNALSKAKQVEAVPSESPGEGFASMCEARVRYAAAQIEKANECAREALAWHRRAGNLWGEAEVFEHNPIWLGRPAEAEQLRCDSLPRAERAGHQNAVWVCKLNHAELLLSRGDLNGAERAARNTSLQ
jgi:tetratricopeptide (TPR) repeat protein